MAQDRKPGQPAWKAAAGPSKASAGGPQYGWKPHEQAAKSQWGRRAKLGAVLLTGLGCVALIVILIFWLKPSKGACLVLVGADPIVDAEKLDAPPDSYGWHAGERLAKWADEAADADKSFWGRVTPQLRKAGQKTPESLLPDDVPALMQDLGRKNQPVAFYFGLHGGADPRDGPFLFTAGGKRLSVRTLIKEIATHLKDRPVVLLFDTGRLTPDPELGLLHDDFVRSLQRLDDEKVFDEAPKLVVICGSDAGERGWSAEEWGTTGFAEAVRRGLSGAAVGSQGDLISAEDLFRYVSDQTHRWSRSTRPTAQTPILLPRSNGVERARDIPLTARIADPVGWPDAVDFKPDSEAGTALEARLTECRKLERGTPSPAVYTPRLWRRYRELLLRYEYLLRSGESSTAASDLAEKLVDAERRLDDGRGLRFTDGQPAQSRGNNLSMAEALGRSTEKPDLDPQFSPLWERDGDWAKLVQDSRQPEEVVRAGFYDFLLRRAAAAKVRSDIDRAARLLALPGVVDPGRPRPAEAQLLAMTQQFVAKVKTGEPPLDVWKQALEVRRLAEEAVLGIDPKIPARDRPHPYSERLWKYLGGEVEKADIRRRDGEDLLASSQPADHAKAGQELAAAAAQYRSVLDQANGYQAAYAARDDALADLPPLTRWAASQPARGETAPLATVVKEAWQVVHQLARRLDGGDRPAIPGEVTKDVRRRVDELKGQYVRACEELAANALDVQADWDRVQQLLSVPPMFVEPRVRLALIAGSRDRALKMLGKFAENQDPVTDSARSAEGVGRAQTEQWARLAVAEVGGVPRAERAAAKNDQELQIPLTNMETAGPQAWQEKADQLGEQLRRHWQLLDESAGVSEDATAAPAGAPQSPEVVETRSRLAVAFRPAPAGAREPATANRQKRWQTLFAGLALRTARDHWYDQQPTEYFRAAAERYLKDGDRCVPADGRAENRPPADDDVRQVVHLVTDLLDPRVTDRLRIEPIEFGARVYWTSDKTRTLRYEVKSKGGPDGYVTLWPELVGPAGSLKLKEAGQRRPERLQFAPKLDLHLEADSFARDGSLKLVATGYFRGQWVDGETEIQLKRTPETVIARATPPEDAAVAVRADDNLSVGAVAIVLDFSGSMAELPGPPGPDGNRARNWQDPNSKNRQAVQTLEKVLLRLPPETPISLRLFGHKIDDAARKNMPEPRLAELTEDELIYPRGKRGTGKVTWSRDNPRPLKDAILDPLKSTEPKWYTPLLRTMEKAKDDFPLGYTGPRTMLVLTDGMDNMYSVAQLKARLGKEFADANVAIQMVLFRADEKELKTAQEQFADVVTFRPPGLVTIAEKNDDLTDLIDQALRPKLRLAELSGGPVAGLARNGLPANRSDDNLTALRWTPAIPAKMYRGSVSQAEQLFRLRAGDRMLVRLSGDSTGAVKFTRDLLAEEPYLNLKDRRRLARTDDWVLGVTYYQAQVESDAQHLWLTASLETPNGSRPGPSGQLQQTRPEFVWWDVAAAQSGPKPTKVRVTDRWDFPAPAWSIAAKDWPGSPTGYKPAVVRVWADAAVPPASYSLTVDPGRLATGDGSPVTVRGDDGTAQVFVSLEDMPLRKDTDPKKDFLAADPPPQSCLVVRVLHPKDRPVFVRPVNVNFQASEQQFYPPAAAVTAVFGPTTKDDLATRLGGQKLELELISVDRFKKDHKPVELEMTPATAGERPAVDPPNLGPKKQ